MLAIQTDRRCTALFVLPQAEMEDGADAVKAALAKTSTASLANVIEMVAAPESSMPPELPR